jgi:hypothetical protein
VGPALASPWDAGLQRGTRFEVRARSNDDRALILEMERELGGFMPGAEPKMTKARRPGELNEPQQRRLSTTCRYIDNLLCDIEHALHSAASQSAFPRYVVDITPAQTLVIEDHIGRLRSQLLRTLAWQHLKPDLPEIPVTRSVLTDLAFVDIALEEIKPTYMRGCGDVPEDAVDELNAVIRELRFVVKKMESYLRHELSANPESQAKP